jgi:hypothetical protein
LPQPARAVYFPERSISHVFAFPNLYLAINISIAIAHHKAEWKVSLAN